MKLREEHWLNARLQAWKDAGLLSAEQRSGIQAFEAESRKRLKVDPLWILAGFAGLCVALGIGLIIAHNWDKIPAWWRQLCFMAGLLGVGVAYQAWQAKGGLGRALGVLWLIAPLLGIGLWAQIYHLSGDPFRPFAIAFVMALPLVWLRRDPMLAVMHVVLLVWGLFAGSGTAGSWVCVREKAGDLLALHSLLALALWAVILFEVRRLVGELARFWAWAFFLIYFAIAAEGRGFNLYHGADGVAFFAALGLLAWAGAWLGVAGKALEDPLVWASALLLYVETFEFKGLEAVWRSSQATQAGEFLLVLVAVLGVLTLLFARLDDLAEEHVGPWGLKALLALPLLVACLGMAEGLRPWALFFANLSLAAVAIYWMFNGVSRGLPKVVNRGVLMLSFLVITRFFDLFDSLLDSGLAFIVGGLALGALAFGLERARRLLVGLAKEGRR